MSDIFISYSRKDSEQALQLAERLQGEGMSVWIDQRGIEAAKTWSEEIVNAIEGSKAFVLLLSSHSIESVNVAKELAIAFESGRVLVPVALEDVTLSAKFKYALAGVQRVAYTQFDKLTTALVGLGVSAGTKQTTSKESSRTICVLPFDDLSPTRDNAWFADGLTMELITALSSIKGLRPVDRQTTMSLKERRLPMSSLAQTLSVRYFIEGAVRKFGDEIKISVSLFDFEEGEYLWQETDRGQFSDIFSMQEKIATKVIEALHMRVLSGSSLGDRSTKVAAAYEEWMKGELEVSHFTKDHYLKGLEHFRAAIAIDPEYFRAIESYTNTILELYRTYDKDPAYLEDAERYIDRIEELSGHSGVWFWFKSKIAFTRRQLEIAEHFGRLALDVSPDGARVYDMMGLILEALAKPEEAASIRETCARLDPRPNNYFKWLVVLMQLGDAQRIATAARESLPVFHKQLALRPHDEHLAVQMTHMYLWAGENEKARALGIEMLRRADTMDSKVLYNLGCVFGNLGDAPNALKALRASVDKGFTNLYQIRTWEANPAFTGSTEFKRIVDELAARESDAKDVTAANA